VENIVVCKRDVALLPAVMKFVRTLKICCSKQNSQHSCPLLSYVSRS